MKFIISLVVTALLSFALCLFLPWWSIAIAAFAVAAAIPQTPFKAFAAAFLALLLLWGGLSFFFSSGNEHLLAGKMAMVILKVPNPFMLILATAIIGALVAGLAGLTGSFVRQTKAVA